jgi:KDEL-tailed cysteine endopeptidase
MASKNQLSYSIALAFIFCLGLCAIQVTSRSLQVDSMYERNEQWMSQYGKVYKDPQEREERLKIFTANVNYIEVFNNDANNKLYKLGINQFAPQLQKQLLLSTKM